MLKADQTNGKSWFYKTAASSDGDVWIPNSHLVLQDTGDIGSHKQQCREGNEQNDNNKESLDACGVAYHAGYVPGCHHDDPCL